MMRTETILALATLDPIDREILVDHVLLDMSIRDLAKRDHVRSRGIRRSLARSTRILSQFGWDWI